MNQIETEDQTSDKELSQIPALEVVPKPEMIRGDYLFKGKPLWPHTLGTRILFNQIIEPKDKMLFVWAAFLFLLVRRGESTASEDRKKHLLPLWDSGELRSAVLDWADKLDEVDLIEAKTIYDKWMAADRDTAVEPLPRDGLPPEKKTARKKRQLSVTY